MFTSFSKRIALTLGVTALSVLHLAAGRSIGSLDSVSVDAAAQTQTAVGILYGHPEMAVRDHAGRSARLWTAPVNSLSL